MLLTRPQSSASDTPQRSQDEILAILDGRFEESRSGAQVNSDTAMQQATVYTCVRIHAETIAQLPLKVQTKNADGLWADSEHDSLELIGRPNDWQTAHDFISHIVSWSELMGNAYFFKANDSTGRTRKLLPLMTSDVDVKMKKPLFALEYKVGGDNLVQGKFGSGEMFHHRNFGANGYTGLSTISLMKNTIGYQITAGEFSSSFFKNRAVPGMMIKAPSATKEQVEEIQSRVDAKFTGAIRAGRTLVLRGDMQAEPLAMTNDDAQFLELTQANRRDIAAFFNIPMFFINDTEKSTTWGSGLEQLFRGFLSIGLAPRLSRLDGTLRRELVAEKDREKTRFVFDTDALTLGEFKDRMEGYRAAVESGVLNPDECREIEGRNPRKDGEKYRIPMNTEIEGEPRETKTEPEPRPESPDPE